MFILDFFKNLFKKEQSTNIAPAVIQANEKRIYSEAKELFEEGVITAIFKYDSLLVCNVANSYYVVFFLAQNLLEEIQFLTAPGEDLKRIFGGREDCMASFRSRPKRFQEMYIFNDRAKTTMRNAYKRVKRDGPDVDLELEAKVLKKYCHRNELYDNK